MSRVGTPPAARPRSMRTAVRAGAAAAAFVLVLVGVLVALVAAFDWSPFGMFDATETVVTERPAVLESLTDIAEFDAASGQFQVVVEVEEDNRFLPAFIAGERVILLAQGEVDAYVDFSDLDELAIQESFNGTRITVVLPPARIDDPVLDFESSAVINRDRGLLTRIEQALSEDGTGITETELYLLAEQQLRDAAEDTELRRRAEENTREMLQSLLGGLGYDEVYVVFSAAGSTPPTDSESP